jgi:hypothetical protein
MTMTSRKLTFDLTVRCTFDVTPGEFLDTDGHMLESEYDIVLFLQEQAENNWDHFLENADSQEYVKLQPIHEGTA